MNSGLNIAVAEKLSALETEEFFRERAAKGDPKAYVRFLEEAGDEAPVEGDELPGHKNR